MKKSCNLGLLVILVCIATSLLLCLNIGGIILKGFFITILFILLAMIFKQKKEHLILSENLKEQKEIYQSVLRHDIKTPVLAQMRAIELLLRGNFGKLNQKQREMLILTLNSCKHSYKIIRAQLYS